MFKIFLTKNEEGQVVKASLGFNGEELLNMLPEELIDAVVFTAWESQEVNEFLNSSNVIHLIAQKVVDVTGMNEEEKMKEFEEITETNFFE